MTSAYWQAQLMNWGPKVLIAILILIATWVIARAVKWVIQKAIDRTPALRRHMTGTPEETVGHQLGTIAKLIIWLVGILAALQFLGFRPDSRSDQRVGHGDLRLPAASDRRGPDFLRRPDRRAHRPPAGRDGADRGKCRRTARPHRHRLQRRHRAHLTRRGATGNGAGFDAGKHRQGARHPRLRSRSSSRLRLPR